MLRKIRKLILTILVFLSFIMGIIIVGNLMLNDSHRTTKEINIKQNLDELSVNEIINEISKITNKETKDLNFVEIQIRRDDKGNKKETIYRFEKDYPLLETIFLLNFSYIKAVEVYYNNETEIIEKAIIFKGNSVLSMNYLSKKEWERIPVSKRRDE